MENVSTVKQIVEDNIRLRITVDKLNKRIESYKMIEEELNDTISDIMQTNRYLEGKIAAYESILKGKSCHESNRQTSEQECAETFSSITVKLH